MAVRIDANGDFLHATTPGGLTNFTEMFWFYYVAVSFDSQIISYMNDQGVDSQWIELRLKDTEVLSIDNQAASDDGSTLTAGSWYHLALVKEGSVYTLYLNGVLDATFTDASSVAAINRRYLNNPFGANFWANARYAAYKHWEAALTVAEIVNELRQVQPCRTENLYRQNAFLLGTSLANECQSAGGTWVANGSLTTEDGPPIPWRAGRRRFVYVPSAAPRRWFLGAH